MQISSQETLLWLQSYEFYLICKSFTAYYYLAKPRKNDTKSGFMLFSPTTII